MQLSERINKIGESGTLNIFSVLKEMLNRGENVIDMAIGEPDFPTPVNIKDAAKIALDNNQTHYTLNQGLLELRNAICNKLKNENGLKYSPNEIIVSAGAKQSLFNALQSLINDKDEVLIPSPYYVSYPEMVKFANGIPKFIPASEKNEFKLKAKDLEKAITQNTKVLIFSFPTNPTGTCYSLQELEAIVAVIEKKNIFVVSDDIYEKIIFDNAEFYNLASINKNIKHRMIVVNGFSKSYAMTGWRIGYAAGPGYIINAMNKLQSHSTSNASSISQTAAIEALNGPQNSVNSMREEFERRRNFVYESISAFDGIKCFKPKGTFYFFPNIKYFFGKRSNNTLVTNSYDLSMYLLKSAKVATVPGSFFGAEGYIRLSISNSSKNLKEGIARVKDALSKLN